MKGDAANYWRRTRRLTLLLLVLWITVTFGLGWFARELNALVILGFPLGFYFGAQGSLLIYFGIIWFYNRQMRKLDKLFGIEDD